MQQHVAAAYGVENILAVQKPRGQPRDESRILEVGTVHEVANRQQPVQVDRTVDHVQIVLTEFKAVHQVVRHFRRAVVSHLQAHRVAITT